MGLVAKIYMREGFLVLYVRKCENILTISEEAVGHI
jgi:hypothetical protein